VASVSAVGLTDVLRWLRLNRLLGNGIALIAVVWTLRDFFRVTPEDQLVAIANMLGYLQMVLLFQEKNARVYWQLLVLSLLEVVVAAVLYLGPEFGFLLCLYLALAITTLVLLWIYRELGRHHCAAAPFSPRREEDWQ